MLSCGERGESARKVLVAARGDGGCVAGATGARSGGFDGDGADAPVHRVGCDTGVWGCILDSTLVERLTKVPGAWRGRRWTDVHEPWIEEDLLTSVESRLACDSAIPRSVGSSPRRVHLRKATPPISSCYPPPKPLAANVKATRTTCQIIQSADQDLKPASSTTTEQRPGQRTANKDAVQQHPHYAREGDHGHRLSAV